MLYLLSVCLVVYLYRNNTVQRGYVLHKKQCAPIQYFCWTNKKNRKLTKIKDIRTFIFYMAHHCAASANNNHIHMLLCLQKQFSFHIHLQMFTLLKIDCVFPPHFIYKSLIVKYDDVSLNLNQFFFFLN